MIPRSLRKETSFRLAKLNDIGAHGVLSLIIAAEVEKLLTDERSGPGEESISPRGRYNRAEKENVVVGLPTTFTPVPF